MNSKMPSIEELFETFLNDEIPDWLLLPDFWTQGKRKSKKKRQTHFSDCNAGVNVVPPHIRTSFARNYWKHFVTNCNITPRVVDQARTLALSRERIVVKIGKGVLRGRVFDDEVYKVHIRIKRVDRDRWTGFLTSEATTFEAIWQVLQGELPADLCESLTEPGSGFLPQIQDIEKSCTCAHSGPICSHALALLLSVSRQIDSEPNVLFRMRHVSLDDFLSKKRFRSLLSDIEQSDPWKKNELAELFGVGDRIGL